jgi:predicted amidohydrolase
MKIAAIQLNSQDNVQQNLDAAGVVVSAAAHAGAETVLLPEGFAYLGPEENKVPLAEKLGAGGPIQDRIISWCQEHEISIIAGGLPEQSEDPARPFNTSVVFDHRGNIVDRYRKVHLFDVELNDGASWNESKATYPGTLPVVTSVDDVKWGLSICYDLRFPEFYISLRKSGAEVLTVPAAFTRMTGAAHWHVLLRARAIESQCWLLAAAQEGEHPGGRKTYGHSMIIDPWGKIVAERTKAGPGFVIAEVDLESAKDVRARMPIEKHRRVAMEP